MKNQIRIDMLRYENPAHLWSPPQDAEVEGPLLVNVLQVLGRVHVPAHVLGHVLLGVAPGALALVLAAAPAQMDKAQRRCPCGGRTSEAQSGALCRG